MPTLRDGLRLFRGRPPAVNVAAILAGFALSTVVYLAVVLSDGGTTVLTSDAEAAVRARQTAAAVAGGVAGLYFGACFTRALGGPFLDVVSVVVVPIVVPAVVGLAAGSLPSPTVAEARRAGFLGEALYLILPGILLLFAVILVWGFVADADEEWVRRHVPDAFRDIDEPPDDGIAPDGSGGSTTERRSADRERDGATTDGDGSSPSTWRVRAVSALLFVGVVVLALALVAIVPFWWRFYVHAVLAIAVGSMVLWLWGTWRYARP